MFFGTFTVPLRVSPGLEKIVGLLAFRCWFTELFLDLTSYKVSGTV